MRGASVSIWRALNVCSTAKGSDTIGYPMNSAFSFASAVAPRRTRRQKPAPTQLRDMYKCGKCGAPAPGEFCPSCKAALTSVNTHCAQKFKGPLSQGQRQFILDWFLQTRYFEFRWRFSPGAARVLLEEFSSGGGHVTDAEIVILKSIQCSPTPNKIVDMRTPTSRIPPGAKYVPVPHVPRMCPRPGVGRA